MTDKKPEAPKGSFKMKEQIATQALDELARGVEGPATKLWRVWIGQDK